jgi:hypothetical protein
VAGSRRNRAVTSRIPDIMCEVFVLAPTDLVDDEEISGSSA